MKSQEKSSRQNSSGTSEQAIEDLILQNEELKKGEQLYHNMIAEVEDYAIILLDPDGNIQNWNRGAAKIKGYKAEEIIGQNFRKFYTQDDLLARLPDSLLEIARKKGRVHHQGWRVRKDGSTFWGNVVITALHDDENNVIGFSKVTNDLTESKRQEKTLSTKEEALRRSEERYHRMISEVEDYAIILLDTSGNIQNWNKGAEKIKGYSAEEIIGQNFRKFYTQEDLDEKLPDALLDEARIKGKANHEGWRKRKDGTRFWGSIVITALHDDENNVNGFSKVTRDLTERRNHEESLKTNTQVLEEKNRELETMNQELAAFAYVSSHDLQEPLRKIQTFASRIVETEHENLSSKGKDYFIRMQNAALRMQTLIEDLLAYSRTNTGDKKFEIADLNRMMVEVQSDLRETIDEKQAIITIHPLPTLKVIAFQFHQLLVNLLSNALKFSKPDVRPQIELKADIVHGSKIPFGHPNIKNNYHHISVSDNGIGFEQEYSQKIFEVFQRLHGRSEYSGTGIGLAICKKIVDNHGGIIGAEAVVDKGATFHIYLPKEIVG